MKCIKTLCDPFIIMTLIFIFLVSSCRKGIDVTYKNTNLYTPYGAVLKEICINSQTYYFASKMLAIKLNDNGKPVKCK